MSLLLSILVSSLLGMLAGFIIAFKFLIDVADHRLKPTAKRRMDRKIRPASRQFAGSR
jgi:hypothetical protein